MCFAFRQLLSLKFFQSKKEKNPSLRDSAILAFTIELFISGLLEAYMLYLTNLGIYHLELMEQVYIAPLIAL